MRIELVTAGFFAVLMLGLLGGLPFLREAIIENARIAVDRVLPASWTAYYLELDDPDGTASADPEAADHRLMFASGSLPGRAARILAARVLAGTWSPSGERFVASSGTRLFLADRDGQVRQLTDLGDLHPTTPPMWSGDDELLVPVTRNGRQQWLVRLDSRSGMLLDQRDIAVDLSPFALSPDGRWIIAVDQRAGAAVLYELATGRRTASGPGESFAAWLGDGRILVSVERGKRLTARRPDGGGSETLLDLEGLALVPGVSSGGRVAIIEAQAGDGTGPRSIWLISPGRSPQRVAKDLGLVYFAKPSGDGRYVGFAEHAPGTPPKLRAGVIEVATRRVAYTCDGCEVLDVR